jgi:hypothetical protein
MKKLNQNNDSNGVGACLSAQETPPYPSAAALPPADGKVVNYFL